MIYSGQHIRCEANEAKIATLTFDLAEQNVNKFNAAMLADLEQCISALETNECSALILVSAKRDFFVGADIGEFLQKFTLSDEALSDWLQKVHRLFRRIENLPFPTVSAINGICLGGGMELVLSTDYRVGNQQAKIGLPEVKLGIIPGWGGTIRLPRLIGIDNALEWIASGKQNSAASALKVGALDGVTETNDLLEAAMIMASQAANNQLNWRQKRAIKQQPVKLNETEQTMAFATAQAVISQQAGPHYPAPYAALKSVQQQANLDGEAASKVEVELFVGVAKSPVAECLVQLFFNDQVLKKQSKSATKNALPTDSLAVLGAGIMGGGIAYQAASSGLPVVMKDIRQEALELGMQEATKLFTKQVERGKLATSDMAQAIARITPSLSKHVLADSNVVIEAVVENLQVKLQVLQEMDQLLNEDSILCTNTSTISINELSRALSRPQNFCGMHFFNPVHRMPLVEVIKSSTTSDETIASVVSLASQIGKKPIVVNDCAGFYVNRVLFPYLFGFLQMVEEGVDYYHIDRVMEKFGWPMGPAYLIDVVGIDTAVHAAKVMSEAFPERMPSPSGTAIETLYKKQWLGQKSQQGFYQYTLDRKGKPKKSPNEEAHSLLCPPQPKTLDDTTIIARMMIPMLNEVARCLEEKIVESYAEADMGLILGIGFPPFRGGPLKYLDQHGLDNHCQTALSLRPISSLYQPPQLLVDMAANQQKFYPL